MTNTEPRTIIRAKRVRQESGLQGGEIYKKGSDPEDDFPAPLELGPHSVGWYLDEVIAWRNSRPRVVQKNIRVQMPDQEAENAPAPA